jgi:hypothetical protein
VIVYDVANPAALRLERLYSVDGSLGESRMIGSKLYMLSTNALSFPYDAYATMNALTSQKLNTAKVAADYNLSRVMPRKTDLYAADSASSANVRIGGKKYPYHVVASDVADCSSIDLVLPDASTLEKFDFTPSFTTLSIIDTSAPTKAVKTNLLFGNVGDVFMSQKNLYIAAPLYVSQNFVCPVGAMCALPYFPAGADTLIHKFSLDNSKASYKNTAIVPGDILNQYSMDEDGNGNFRIVTKNTYPKQESSVFIFDKSLSLVGALRGIGKDENFQSSRFIGDKLFLVTFQNIDPLFVIDLADQTRPRIIGELKMPGYSTYLHPYDPSRLIGLGYDTITNQWGGTQNG